MKIREILWEDYNIQLSTDIDDLLVAAKAHNVGEIPTSDMLKYLQSAGYSIDIDSLLGLLQNNPVVQNATTEIVTIFEPESTQFDNEANNGEDSEQQVDKMAQTAAAKGIKQ